MLYTYTQLGSWTLILAPLGRLTYGVYLGGLSIQLFYVSSARTQIYFNQFLVVSNITLLL